MAVIVDTDSAGRVRRMYYEEDKMTPEERAVEIIDEGIVNRTWLTDKIEQAIIAAVEEERDAFEDAARNEIGAEFDSAFSRLGETVRRIVASVRARSTTSPVDTEGEKE